MDEEEEEAEEVEETDEDEVIETIITTSINTSRNLEKNTAMLMFQKKKALTIFKTIKIIKQNLMKLRNIIRRRRKLKITLANLDYLLSNN